MSELISRGKISYKGFSDILGSFKNIGLMNVDEESRIQIESWSDLVPTALRTTLGTLKPSAFLSSKSLRSGLLDVIPDSHSIESTFAAMSEYV